MTTLSLPAGEVPRIRLVSDNPNYLRPAVFRSRLGKLREFTAKFKLVTNEAYLSPEEKRAIELADYLERGFHEHLKRQMDEKEARIYLAAPPSTELGNAAIKILRERGFGVTFAHNMTGGGGVRFTLVRTKKK